MLSIFAFIVVNQDWTAILMQSVFSNQFVIRYFSDTVYLVEIISRIYRRQRTLKGCSIYAITVLFKSAEFHITTLNTLLCIIKHFDYIICKSFSLIRIKLSLKSNANGLAFICHLDIRKRKYE